MRFPWRQTQKAALPAPPAEAGPGPYRTRYDIAREGYEVRVGELARALDQSTLRNYLALGCAGVLAAGLVTVALRGGVRPVFIPYDKFGRVIEYDDLGRFREPPRLFVEAALAEWLVATRGIYYNDPVAQLDRGRKAKALLAPEAEQWLGQYFSEPTRNPALLLRDVSRTVDVVSISKDPERSLWYLQWREVEIPARGALHESAWQATLKVSFAPAVTEAAVWANPAGIRIESIEWNRLRQKTSAPQPQPGAGASPASAPAEGSAVAAGGAR